MLGQLSYMFLSCEQSTNLPANLTSTCNTNCYCNDVAYSPVCSVKTGVTFFSPCHAACNNWDNENKIYSGCSCAAEGHTYDDNFHENTTTTPGKSHASSHVSRLSSGKFVFFLGPCLAGCVKTFYLFTFVMFAVNWLSSTGRIGNILLSLRLDFRFDILMFQKGLIKINFNFPEPLPIKTKHFHKVSL